MNTNRPKRVIERMKKGIDTAKHAALSKIKLVEKEIRGWHENKPWLKEALVKKPVGRLGSEGKKVKTQNVPLENPIQKEREAAFSALSNSEQRHLQPSNTLRSITVKANTDLGIPVVESLAESPQTKEFRNIFTKKKKKATHDVAKDRIIKLGIAASAALGGAASVGFMQYDSLQRGDRISGYTQNSEVHSSSLQDISYNSLKEAAKKNGMEISSKSFQLPDGEILSYDSILKFGELNDQDFTVQLQGALAKKFSLVKVSAPSEEAFVTHPDSRTVASPTSDIRIETNPQVKHYERIYLQIGENYGGEKHELSDTSRFLPLLEIRESESWEVSDM